MPISRRYDELYSSSLSEADLRMLSGSEAENLRTRKALCIAIANRELDESPGWVDADTEYFCGVLHDIYSNAAIERIGLGEVNRKWRFRFVDEQTGRFVYHNDGVAIECYAGHVLLELSGKEYTIRHAFLADRKEEGWLADITACEAVDTVLKKLKKNGHWKLLLREALP